MKSQWLSLLLSLYTFALVSAQGGNSGGGSPGGTLPGTGTDTLPDTTYYQSGSFGPKEKINTIMQFNADKTPKRYTVYYVNGQICYYELFEWVQSRLSKEIYYNASNQITFYGTYSTASGGGMIYKYFDKNSVLLSEAVYGSTLSSLDSTRQCITYKVRTAFDHIRFTVNYEYSTDGWLLKEKYFDHNGDSLGVGSWGWDPLTRLTAYIYKCKNNKRIFSAIGDQWYDQYRYYYHGTSKTPDSLKVYFRDALLYVARYEYDASGWMIKDRYYDRENKPIYHGEYSFDKPTNVTTYSYFKEPAEPLTRTTYDFRYYYLTTGFYKAGLLDHNLTYVYNTGGYWDTVHSKSPSGSRISYETYESYLPYYWTKKFTTYDAASRVTSYYSYNEYGDVTDSMSFGTTRSSLPLLHLNKESSYRVQGTNLYFSLSGSALVQLTITSLSGRCIATVNRHYAAGNHQLAFSRKGLFAPGIYLLSGYFGAMPVTTTIYF